jgi:hypothetical protein
MAVAELVLVQAQVQVVLQVLLILVAVVVVVPLDQHHQEQVAQELSFFVTQIPELLQ